MRHPATRFVVVSVMLLFLLGGCTFPGKTAEEPEANRVAITDPERMEHIWSTYIFDGITTVCNTEFDDPSEITIKSFLVGYAFQRMIKDGDIGPGSIELNGQTIMIQIPPVELVQSKIKQCFDLDVELDYEQVLREGFGVSADQTVNVYTEQFALGAPNPWGISLRSITYDQDQGDYEVILDSYANPKTGRIARTTHINLGERSDNSLYYRSVRYEYPETSFVEIIGEHVKLEAEEFGAELNAYSSPVAMYGCGIGDKLLLRADRLSDPNDHNSANITTFSIYDPQENKVERQLQIPYQENSRFHGVRVLPDQLIFKMTDSYFVTTPNLVKIGDGTRPLPDAVRKALADKDYGGAYDVSADLKKFAFIDRNGLSMHDVDSGQTTRLSSHIPVKSDLINKTRIIAPHFSPSDEAIVSMLAGYEGYYGVMGLNLGYPDRPYIERIPGTMSSLDWTNAMYPFVHTQSSGVEGKFELERMDFEAFSNPLVSIVRQIQQIDFSDDATQQPYASMDSFPMYNGRYLAYVATRYEDGSYPEEQTYHIVRIDLKTMKAETVLSLKAGQPYIRAVTEDGRVVFSYHFERELGLAITGG